jgi:hypothetical protein
MYEPSPSVMQYLIQRIAHLIVNHLSFVFFLLIRPSWHKHQPGNVETSPLIEGDKYRHRSLTAVREKYCLELKKKFFLGILIIHSFGGET